ncbi:MAG: hypothetical protein PHS79_03345 [Patescibacteria group bacterium]|nr:hypothetical protein [Patescibacteria group bacterium]
MAQAQKKISLSALQKGEADIEQFIQRKEKSTLRLVTESGPKGPETVEQAQAEASGVESESRARVSEVSELGKGEPRAEPAIKASEAVAVEVLQKAAGSVKIKIEDLSARSDDDVLEHMKESYNKLTQRLSDMEAIGNSQNAQTIEELKISIAQLKVGLINEQDRFKRETRNLKKTKEEGMPSKGKSIEDIFESDDKGYVPLESLRSSETVALVPKKMRAEPESGLSLPSGVVRTGSGWRASPSERRARPASVSAADLPIVKTYDKVPLETEAEKTDSIRMMGAPDYGTITPEQRDELSAINQELIEVRSERQKYKDDPEKSKKFRDRYTELKEMRKRLIDETHAEPAKEIPLTKVDEPEVEPPADKPKVAEDETHTETAPDETVVAMIDEPEVEAATEVERERDHELSTFLSLHGRLREVHQEIKELRGDKEANKDRLAELYREELELKNQIVNVPSDLSLSNEVGLGVSVDRSRTFDDTMYLSEQLQDRLLAVHQEIRILRKDKDANKDELVRLYQEEREIKQGILGLINLDVRDNPAVEKKVESQQTANGDVEEAAEDAVKKKRDYSTLKKVGAIGGVGLAGGALVGAGLFAKAYYWIRWRGPLKLLEGLMKFTGDPGGVFTKTFNKFEALDPYKTAQDALKKKGAKKEK